MSINLRERQRTKNGKVSLYLDYYLGTTIKDGKTIYKKKQKSLKLYVYAKPKTAEERRYNKTIYEIAYARLSELIVQEKNGQFGFVNKNLKSGSFIEYYKVQMNKRINSKGNHYNWHGMLQHLINFTGGALYFENIDDAFCNELLNYLIYEAKKKDGKPLEKSSINSYFSKFKACILQAVKDKIIQINPCISVQNVKPIQAKREYLSMDEVDIIAQTECKYTLLKRAFLFSCLTGLRWSDIHKLKWSEVKKTETGTRITFHQQKTNGLQYLDIKEQARELMGEEGQPDELVFFGLTYNIRLNENLRKWMLSAGITKKITFHCARHTFATLLLNNGVELYTVQKLLGHSNIATTQIYANITDDRRREAVNRIPDLNFLKN